MQEDLLHYVWRTRRFEFQNLITTEGETVEIIFPGVHNTHAGPDFFDARIRIGDTLWAGNVEMHLVASEWETHRHGEDRAYDNVVLHVVWEEDLPVLRGNGERIPCVELKKRIPAATIKTYRELLHNEYWIPCQHHFHRVPDITRQIWLDRLMVERLESKTAFIAESLERNHQHWEETFYQVLARNFGVKVNAEPFEALARSLPLNLLSKHKNNLLQLEALLFGQAGLLAGVFEDDYPQRLQKEYAFLQHKYSLQPIAGSSWKFLRMRPANFPSLRIAQFATLIHQSAHLFSKILVAQNVEEIENMFEVRLSNYWQTHYIFGKASAKRAKTLGQTAIHLLVINTIAPFLFVYGKLKAEPALCDRALRLLESVPPESNSIIENWQRLGMEPVSAGQTQALLQLKNGYCDKRQCLRCAVGNEVMRG